MSQPKNEDYYKYKYYKYMAKIEQLQQLQQKSTCNLKDANAHQIGGTTIPLEPYVLPDNIEKNKDGLPSYLPRFY